jgi:hypothetical protein
MATEMLSVAVKHFVFTPAPAGDQGPKSENSARFSVGLHPIGMDIHGA